VLVLEPLPLVQLSLLREEGEHEGPRDGGDGLGLLPPAAPALAASSPPARSGGGGGGGPPALRLLQGQAYAARLQVTNSSKVAVGWGNVTVR
jgi:hypothetical protein